LNQNPYDGLRILAVEDNPGDVLLLTEAFKEGRIRAQLNVVTNGEEALDYLQGTGRHAEARIPDLILLDLNLPRMDGRALLRRLKSDPAFQSLPVIVLSSSSLATDIREAYDMNASCYIVKPSDLDGFFKVANSLRDFWFSQVRLPSRPEG
jgi:chemotaxis family two-component system response regulator Rcp1